MFFYTFMPKLINMSLTASVAIVLVILLRLVLKRVPKVVSYALWSIVLFRLLCPVSIGSSFSLFNLIDAPTEDAGTVTSIIEYVPTDIVHTENPSVVLPVPGVSDVINEALPQGQEQLVADPLEAPMAFVTYIWMAGVIAMVVYSVVSYIKLRRRLSVVIPLRDNIFIADDIKSPFVVGMFRPKIYLPCNLGAEEQEYIILHEQHHIKRLDHIVKALAFLALTIHWFNPLVWVAFILSSKDMEMSCDEAVIRKLGSDVRADYSASLLTLATGRRIIAGTPLAFGEGDTKGRINNLSKWKKPAFWVVLVAVVACVVLAVCLLTNPNSSSRVLKYSYTSYLSDTQQTEVMQAYNRERKALSITVNFETTEGPLMIELVYGHKKNGTGNEWIYNEPVSMVLGDSTTFTVPADHHFSFAATSLDGANGNVTFVFSESKTTGVNSDNLAGSSIWHDNSTELIPGTTYVSYQCLYMNPLSSYAAMGSDSGYRYIINENGFVILNRNSGSIVSINSNPSVETGESLPVSYEADVDKWEWQVFPYTDEEWAELYVPGGFGAMENISEAYDEILYQPLEKNRFLLRVDGGLWLVELKNNQQMGTYLWSIYSLVPESAMGFAQWEFAPMLSSRLPVFRIEFNMEYTSIQASCDTGMLVPWDTPGGTSDSFMTYKEGCALYWSPSDQDGKAVTSAKILFTVMNGDTPVYQGNIYLEGNSGSDGRRIYNASLIGTGMYLSPNLENEGAVISVRESETESEHIQKYDLTQGKLEIPIEELANYAFYTNSTKISVKVKSDLDFEGSFTLIDVSQNNAEIAYKKVNTKDKSCVFSNLTSARIYRIESKGLEGCTLIIS